MSSLKELIGEAFAIEQKLLETEGEITPEIQSLIEMNDFRLPHKVDSYAGVMDRLEKSSEFYYEKAKKMQKIADGLGAAVVAIRERMKYLMVANKIEELKGHEERFVLAKTSGRVEISEAAELPESYKKTTITSRPDIFKIKDALEKGEVFPGVQLVKGVSLRRYLRKD